MPKSVLGIMVKAAWGSDLVAQPPRTVTAAIVVLIAEAVIGVASISVWPHKIGFIAGVILSCLNFAFVYVFSRAFYRGEKWSRWAWLTIVVLEVVGIPHQLSRMYDAWLSMYLFLAVMFLQLASVALLYVPSSHRWFSTAVRGSGQAAV
jgi:hypothetical protein